MTLETYLQIFAFKLGFALVVAVIDIALFWWSNRH